MNIPVKTFIISAIAGWLLMSCAKDGSVGPSGSNGTTGPAGAIGTTGATGTTGTTGTTGAQGAKGENGNSDAKAYLFNAPFTFSSSTTTYNLTVPGLNARAMDSLLVLGYYYVNVPSAGGADAFYWNPGGSLGPRGNYFMRFFYDESFGNEMIFNIRSGTDGTLYTGPDVEVLKFKVIVIPANKINGRRAVDFVNYAQTMNFLGLTQ